MSSPFARFCGALRGLIIFGLLASAAGPLAAQAQSQITNEKSHTEGQTLRRADPPSTTIRVADNITALTAGTDHTCAVVSSGVRCWGDNFVGQVGDGTTTDRSAPVNVNGLGVGSGVTTIAAGALHTCALVSGGVKCWGWNMQGQLGDSTTADRLTPVSAAGLGAGSGVTAIAAGWRHSCAVINGGVKCWGYNAFGQLGDGTTISRSVPTEVSGLGAGSGVTAIAAGNSHTCAIVNGGVKCWGSGQLGDGTTINNSTPVDVSGLGAGSGVTAIATGGDHTCVVVSGGAKCWGSNSFGQVGDDTTATRFTPTDVSGLGAGSGVTTVAAGKYDTCAVVSGGVKCWGRNDQGQLGDGTAVNHSTPLDVSGLEAGNGVIAIATGAGHTCAMRAGNVKCWGYNGDGQLGDGTAAKHFTSVDVNSLEAESGVTALAMGEVHTCALVNGGVKCWGANYHGQLGDGTLVPHFIPLDVNSLGAGVGVFAAVGGALHTCVVISGGVKCWGLNDSGQLGTGTIADSPIPTNVSSLGMGSGVTAIAAGHHHTCAVVNDGAKCWGYNAFGQVGDGTTTTPLTPADVSGLGAGSGVTAIAAGVRHTCAVVNGGVKCWGENSSGQLGDGTTTNHSTPADVSGLEAGSGVLALTAGSAHTCALVSGGVKCWGWNYGGQLGDGTTTDRSAPLDVSGLEAGSGVTALAAGIGHTCAVVSEGVKCWGWNMYGQLGDGTAIDRFTPVEVSGLGPGSSVTFLDTGGGHTCALVSGGVKCWGWNSYGQLGADPGWTPVDVRRLDEKKLYLPLIAR